MKQEEPTYIPTSRRKFLTDGTKSLLGLMFSLPALGCRSTQALINYTLVAAGNAEDEKTRFRMLKELIGSPKIDLQLLQHLDDLLPYIDRWANGKEIALAEWENRENKPYLSWSVREARIDNDLPAQPPTDSPVYPLWCWYRSRMLIWRAIEDGSIKGNPELLARYYGEAQRLLLVARDAFPENRIIPLYLGGKTPWPKSYDSASDVPSWAADQRIAMGGMQDIIHWWIDNRQLPDGQYGGGWGDDVEMWRWWTPWLIGRQDQKINDAQRRLSRGLFQLEKMTGGYTNLIDDVEHTAEDSADTITAMMHIDPDDDEWKARALHLVALMKDLWTGINERGFLQFKSTYFTATEVDLTPRKACDTVYHPRAVQPALLLWQRTGNPELTDIFTQWLRTWVDAAARAERGKPAGIIPSAIHWPDGRVGGLGENWWKPGNYTDNPLYVWPSSMSMMTNSLLLAFHMTGERTFLRPIISMAEIRMEFLRRSNPTPHEPGSKYWCAAQMHRFLPGTLAKYRLITGDRQFDELLRLEEDPYIQYSFFEKQELFQREMKNNATALSQNFPCFTSEVRWTDRVIAFNRNYLQEVYPETVIPNYELLYASITGDPGDPLYFPLNGFQWLVDKNELSVRVKNQSNTGANIKLYGFFNGEKTVGMKTYLLKKGTYQVVISAEDGRVLHEHSVALGNGTNTVKLKIPGRRLVNLEIR